MGARGPVPAAGCLDVEIRPSWPYRLPAGGGGGAVMRGRRGGGARFLHGNGQPPPGGAAPRRGGDAVMRVRRGVVTRFLHVNGQPAVVRAAQRRDGTVLMRAEASSSEDRERVLDRMRFALGVDDDYREVYERFRRDRLLGGAIR